nr:MAG TPA: major capsid protein [Caudoviricetes sp.]
MQTNLMSAYTAAMEAAGALQAKGLETPEEIEEFNKHVAEAKSLKESMEERASAVEMLKGLSLPGGDATPANHKTLGDFTVDSLKELLPSMKANKGTYSTPEFKANEVLATDELRPFATVYDHNLVLGKRERPVVADLFSASTIAGAAISYLVEGAKTGEVTAVAQGAAKPQLGFGVEPVTEALAKLAGWIRVSDEFLEDYAGLASEINGRLVYEVGVAEEAALLNGTGAGGALKGILNRNGVQVLTSAKVADNADTMYKATTAISTASNLIADGVVLNPADYEAFRLAKDTNAQYYGGGFFTGAYGVDGFASQPNLWGLRTVITSAMPKGTALVGAFRTGGTVYRKGGVQVDIDTSGDNFIHNFVTIRAEERLALAVRVPSAFVKVTLSSGV